MEKQNNKFPLTEGEKYIDYYIRFMTDKDTNGFCDLFYQEFSLDECKKIIYWFSCLGLHELSEKFKEALNIYCRNKNVNSQEFKQLEPFSIEEGQGNLFDEIGRYFDTDDCGLYNCEELIRNWIIDNKELFDL
jgi:hypothetical protein